jgi:hypothetical protein
VEVRWKRTSLGTAGPLTSIDSGYSAAARDPFLREGGNARNMGISNEKVDICCVDWRDWNDTRQRDEPQGASASSCAICDYDGTSSFGR